MPSFGAGLFVVVKKTLDMFRTASFAQCPDTNSISYAQYLTDRTASHKPKV